jgi:hypothetical protein
MPRIDGANLLKRRLKKIEVVNADGSVTETDTDEHGEVSHVDEFPLPDGNAFTWVVTDPGMILSGIETRGSGPLDRR